MANFPDYLDIENLVRPALPMRAGRYVRDDRIPEETKKPPELLISGGIARDVDGQFMQWSWSIKTEDDSYEEVKDERETEIVRIEDPDDPNIYVEVERMKKATFTDEQSGRKMSLKFANWDDGRR